MIHEIAPDYMDNQYKNLLPDENSTIFYVFRNQILARHDGNEIVFPSYADWQEFSALLIKDPAFTGTDPSEFLKYDTECGVVLRYLFSISGKTYFWADFDYEDEHLNALLLQTSFAADASWQPVIAMRDARPVYKAFAGMTAQHLATWYTSVHYCGRCGHKAVHDSKERMMRCPSCRNLMFPKISPAIVVAVTDGERLLLTRYSDTRGGTRHSYALVAGFIEIGETMEECVQRELLEETGVHVKNIKYYGSQPWGVAGNLMIGFTAELDGAHTISLDEDELAEAVWMKPEEIPEIPDYSSLTRHIIRSFREGTLFPRS